MADAVVCKTCDRGELMRVKIRRMNGVVVFIGFILLIPSFLGIGIGTLGMVGGGVVASQSKKTQPEIEKELRDASVPEEMITRLLAGRPTPAAELEALTPPQVMAVQKAQMAVVSKELGSVALFGGAAVIIVVSLVGGLLGWLLISKKWVLQCASCRAVIPAS